MRCRHSSRNRARPSSIQPAIITTTITPCSSSIPDGMKLEGMRYGEKHEQAARKRAAKKRSAAAAKKSPARKK